MHSSTTSYPEPMQALAIYIDSPLQAWGANSKYQYRETNSFPTKSAIIGIVAAAMGIDKHSPDESELIAPLATLKITVVRIDKSSPVTRLTDFHTIGGGYDKKASESEKMSIPRKATGAPFGTVITRRTYLTDATFVAVLEGGSETLDATKKALLNPTWGIWFGRKHCIPATPLTPSLGDSRQAAFDSLLSTVPNLEPQKLESCEYQEDVEESVSEDGIFYQSDQPIAYGKHHGPVPAAYRSRPIRHHRPHK